MAAIKSVFNPRWIDASGHRLSCTADVNGVVSTVTVDSDDAEPWLKKLYDRIVSGEFGPIAPYVGPSVVEMRTAKLAAAWAECERRTSLAVATVTINGVSQPFGCDIGTRENIIGINGFISQETAGLLPAGTVPNPRGWTPKGANAPVAVTHAEFAAIGAALAVKKEAHVVAYLTHKAALSAMTTAAAIAAHDITTGWPAP